MNSRVTTLAGCALAISAAAMAPARAQQQGPGHQLTYNVAVTTDYRYRGVSQSRLDPALQGGADYTHAPTGWYAGTWLSSIQWTKDAGGDDSIEWDIYGGRRGELGRGFSYDAGGLYYFYPDNDLGPNANTFELYGQIGYGPAYVKYSHSLTNLFGAPDSKQSGYLDVGANFDLPVAGLVLNLHVGRQEVNDNDQLSYTDYKVGLTRQFQAATVALAWIKTNSDAYRGPRGQNLGRSEAVLTISKTF